MSPDLLKEFRCSCGKLLFKGMLFAGTVEIKCRRCGELYRARVPVVGSLVLRDAPGDQ